MSALVEFLLARIGEDEESARQAGSGEWESWSHRAGGVDLRDLVENRKRFAEVPSDRDEHIARHNPARVLAECAAKRRIVELHSPVEDQGATVCSECGPDEDVRFRVEAYGRGWPCPTIRTLATVYVDHPDYREEWKP